MLIPVFMIKGLRSLYQDLPWNLDAFEEITNNVNVTGLKEKILKELTTLCKQRDGKVILLTLDRNVGKKLFEVTQNSHKDDSIVQSSTAWKVSKYWVFSGSYFPVFSPNTGKYGPEKTPYLDTFHAVISRSENNIFGGMLDHLLETQGRLFSKNMLK